MATEITWTRRHGLHPGRLERLGGPDWSADAATVVGQIREGREYFLRRGDILLGVAVITRSGRPTLTTDPTECAENALLLLHEPCASPGGPGAEAADGARPGGLAP